MSNGSSDLVSRAHERLDDHAESLEHHDRRISKNENYRLQVQGALKVLAFIIGGGAFTTLLLRLLGL